jgi:flagellin-like hook-associated protein FlgL
MIFGAIRESAMAAARASNDASAAKAVRAELRRLLAALET